MSRQVDDSIDRIRIIVGDTNDLLLRDLATVVIANNEALGDLMSAIEELTAAADRVTTETGETRTLIEQIRAAQDVMTTTIAALTEQVAQGQVDTAAVQAVVDQLQAAADSLNADNAPAEPTPPVDPPVDPPA